MPDVDQDSALIVRLVQSVIHVAPAVVYVNNLVVNKKRGHEMKLIMTHLHSFCSGIMI